MVYYFDYLISQILYSNTYKFVLSFIFLFVLSYGLFSVINVFQRKINLVISVALASITMFNPKTQQLVFYLIPNMTYGILVLFGVIVLLYMASKFKLHDDQNLDIDDIRKKAGRYAAYTVFGFAGLYAYYLMYNSGVIPVPELRTLISYVFVFGVLIGGIYFLIIKPIRNEDNAKATQEQIKNILKSEFEIDREETTKLLDEMTKRGISPESAAYIISKMKKRHD